MHIRMSYHTTRKRINPCMHYKFSSSCLHWQFCFNAISNFCNLSDSIFYGKNLHSNITVKFSIYSFWLNWIILKYFLASTKQLAGTFIKYWCIVCYNIILFSIFKMLFWSCYLGTNFCLYWFFISTFMAILYKLN